MGMIAALLVVALAAWWMFFKPPEDPLCNGVRLSEWLERPGWNQGRPPIQPEDLRAISHKAVPFLAHYLHNNCPQYRKGVAARMPDWLRMKLPPTWIEREVVGNRDACQHALVALEWLGADAEPALPTLIKLQNRSGGMLGFLPARTIHGIGPASWPAVLEVWQSGSTTARKAIIWELPRRFDSALAATDAEKKRSIDLLLQACSDPDPWVQYTASQSLGICRRRNVGAVWVFDPAIPVLIRIAEVGGVPAPEAATYALSEFPEHSGVIVPALKKIAATGPYRGSWAASALERLREKTQNIK